MKKKVLALAMVMIFALAPVSGFTVYAREINVTIDNARVNFPGGQGPVIVDGRTLVPVRGVFEHLGFVVVWNYATRTVELTRTNQVVIITLGSILFSVNGIVHRLEVPAQLVEGRTMLPIRAVLESVGYSVDWNEATGTVLVTSPPPPAPAPTPEPPTVAAATGYTFPISFSATDITGASVTEGSIGEKEIFFVYLWATWCPACVRALPGLAELETEFGDRVGFIGLLLDFNARDNAVRMLNSAGSEFIHVDAGLPALSGLREMISTGFVPTGGLLDGAGNLIGEPLLGGVPRYREAIVDALGS